MEVCSCRINRLVQEGKSCGVDVVLTLKRRRSNVMDIVIDVEETDVWKKDRTF